MDEQMKVNEQEQGFMVPDEEITKFLEMVEKGIY